MGFNMKDYLLPIGPTLKTLKREYEDALWEEETDFDFVLAEKEINRLVEAQQRGEQYDPIF